MKQKLCSIISKCENREWTLVSSGTIDYEISQIPDNELQERISALYSCATHHHNLTSLIAERAKDFHVSNIRHFDSLHMAIAENVKADVMLTTDDRLLKRAQRTNVEIRIANPVTWLMEVSKYE